MDGSDVPLRYKATSCSGPFDGGSTGYKIDGDKNYQLPITNYTRGGDENDQFRVVLFGNNWLLVVNWGSLQ